MAEHIEKIVPKSVMSQNGQSCQSCSRIFSSTNTSLRCTAHYSVFCGRCDGINGGDAVQHSNGVGLIECMGGDREPVCRLVK